MRWMLLVVTLATTTATEVRLVGLIGDQSQTTQPPTRREWAEANVVLPSGPHQGELFDGARIPWAGLFLDELDSGRWNRVAGTGCTQAGKTLNLYAIPVLYHLFALRETVVAGVPTMAMGSDKWQQDLLPVIKASPRLNELLPVRGEGSKGGNVKTAIRFQNGATLRFMAAGGADAARKGFTARVLAITEVDELDEAGEASRESDKVTQLEGRLRAFSRYGYQEYLESTPTIERGRIWQETQVRGTASRIVRPCPLCGAWVTPEREHVIGWEDADDEFEARDNAAWSCPSCAERWTEDQRSEANRASVLVHRGQTVSDSGVVSGPLPRTDTFGFRFSAIDNEFVTASTVGMELWHASRDRDQANAEKKLCQQVFAVPYIPPEVDLTPLEAEDVEKRTSELKRGIVPEWAVGISVGIDTGKRKLHWTAIAWGQTGRGHVLEYGEQPVDSANLGTYRGLIAALNDLAEYFRWESAGESSRVWDPSQVWIDARYHEHTNAVVAFCRGINKQVGCQPGRERWRPAMGYGEGQRSGASLVGRYTAPKKRTNEIKYIGRELHFAASKQHQMLIVHVNSDHWKSELHQRLAMPPDAEQAITLYDAPTRRAHAEFARHLTAEKQVEEYVEGRGDIIKWERIDRQNHWLDASYNATAAGWAIVDFIGRRQPTATKRNRGGLTMPDGRPFVQVR